MVPRDCLHTIQYNLFLISDVCPVAKVEDDARGRRTQSKYLMKGGRTLFWHSVASCMGATKERERFLVVHARREPHITHEGGGSEGNKRGEGNGIVLYRTKYEAAAPGIVFTGAQSSPLAF